MDRGSRFSNLSLIKFYLKTKTRGVCISTQSKGQSSYSETVSTLVQRFGAEKMTRGEIGALEYRDRPILVGYAPVCRAASEEG
jgi:hypothetical protein